MQPAEVSNYPLVRFIGTAAALPSNRSPDLIHEEKLREVVKSMNIEMNTAVHMTAGAYMELFAKNN